MDTAKMDEMARSYSGNCNCVICKSLRDEEGRSCSGCKARYTEAYERADNNERLYNSLAKLHASCAAGPWVDNAPKPNSKGVFVAEIRAMGDNGEPPSWEYWATIAWTQWGWVNTINGESIVGEILRHAKINTKEG